MEMWDIYDKNKMPMGRTHERGKPLNDGEYHIVENILTMNSQGQILVTRRDKRKTSGGMWEITGGSKVAGESSVDGAIRELFEETGIKVTNSEITYIRDFKTDHYFHDYYIVHKDIPKEDIVLQEGETIDAKWITPQELMKMAKNHTFVLHTAMRLKEIYPDMFGHTGIVKGIHHVSLKACGKEKFDKTVDFYCEKLGLALAKKWDGGVMISSDSGIIEIFQTEEQFSDGVVNHFALETDNVEKCMEISEKAGCEVLVPTNCTELPTNPPMRIKMGFVRGFSGEKIEFFMVTSH